MSAPFTFTLPTRIVWHTPAEEGVATEVELLGAHRVLIVTDPGLVATGLPDRIAGVLRAGGVDVALQADVAGNPTTDDLGTCLSRARDHDAEALVAVGGGSAIDTAKAAAMLLANGGSYAEYQWEGRQITERSHPLVAVPTTAGTGSEVSRVAVISDPGQPFKKGVLSPLMFAHAAVIDPAATLGLPPHLTAATGIDALVHALEAYTGLRANPMSDLFAIESLRLSVGGLHDATRRGDDLEARTAMMRAAIYGGIAMDHAGLGLVHALSGGLCSHMHLHHGLANAMILPYVADFNASAIPSDRRRVLNRVFGLDETAGPTELVDAITDFVRTLDLPIGLADRREETAQLDWGAIAAESMRMVMVHNNPRSVTVDDCRALLDAMA